MRNVEALAEVVKLACLTNDRAPEEQRALLDVALGVDRERGAFLSANFRGENKPIEPFLVRYVEETYEPSEGRRVALTKQQRRSLDRLESRWVRCPTCGQPDGVHGPGDPPASCPRDGSLDRV